MPNFEELRKTISPVLKRITWRLNGHFGYFNAEDLYQEALLHLWQDYNSGKLSDKTDSYILQGCYFHLKNYIRTHGSKFRAVSIYSPPDAEEPQKGEFMSLEDECSRDDFSRLNDKLLVEAINNNGLTPKEKYILALCSEGLSLREMGSRLGVSHVSVVKRMSKIRQKCKKYLE